MTVRSASARRLSERPTISFVFPVHDPEYGGGLLARTQKHIDALIDLANRYRLLSEIIIVEWNPRQDRAPFRESLRWPDDLGHVCLRFLEVPAEVHRTLPNADRIPIFEYIAKNAGLRRARGQFLLATNPDLFYSPALIRWLAHASLSPEKFYRVDRRDLFEEIPADLSLPRQLRFCSQHVADVHALYGSYRLGDADSGRRLRDEYERSVHDPSIANRWTDTPDARLMFPADGLHRNAAGDFFLMEREWWHRLRGYPELYTHAHIDAILCWVAASAGLVQEILPARCHLYHQAHHRASRSDFPQTDWRPWYECYQEAVRQDRLRNGPPMMVNPGDWGLAREVLREWQASPELVEVQASSGELDNRATAVADSLLVTETAQRTLRRVLTAAETSLATTRSDLERVQAALEATGKKQAALKSALREARSLHEADRAEADRILRKAQRTHKAEQAALEAALHESQVAQRSEAALRHQLESSTAWRITWPIRQASSSFNRLRTTLRRPRHAERISEEPKPGLIAKPKKGRAPNASHPAVPPVDPSASTPTHDGPPTLAQLLSKRFRELEPLRVFNVPGDAPRVSLVTDSISASSLFAGGGTALAVAALFARHLGARLRVITLTEPPEPANVAAVFGTHRIVWTGDIEFVYVGLKRKEEVPVGDHELFLTTSWWSTRCVLPVVDPGRLLYILQEDERMLCAAGDDRLRCIETLSEPDIRFVVNSRRLFDHLATGPDALPNILANGVWFEPAFPACERTIVEEPQDRKRQFFFYARPSDLRNLHWRGLEAIGAALEENVLDPAEWTVHLAGHDPGRIELPRGVRPNIVQNLPWADYVALVRRIDVGLCLMDAPYPSQAPLDLAASGAVVVTNQSGCKMSPTSDSSLIIRAEASVEGLKHGIREAVALAGARDRRLPKRDGDHLNADWEVALAPVLASLYPNHRVA